MADSEGAVTEIVGHIKLLNGQSTDGGARWACAPAGGAPIRTRFLPNAATLQPHMQPHVLSGPAGASALPVNC